MFPEVNRRFPGIPFEHKISIYTAVGNVYTNREVEKKRGRPVLVTPNGP